MSMPQIPTIVSETININRTEVINLLLASIAMEELSLAHIMNAEAEKIQTVIGALPGGPTSAQATTFGDLLTMNRSSENILRDVIKKEILLQFKLEDIISILPSKCNCRAAGSFDFQPIIALNVNICPSCTLIGSSLSFSSETEGATFVAEEIPEPICSGAMLVVNGTGHFTISNLVLGITFDGTVNYTLTITPGSVIVVVSASGLPFPLRFGVTGGSGLPVQSCITSTDQPLKEITANKKAKFIFSGGNVTKEIEISN